MLRLFICIYTYLHTHKIIIYLKKKMLRKRLVLIQGLCNVCLAYTIKQPCFCLVFPQWE